MPDPNALILAFTEVNASDEGAFNHWYDEVHVPDVLGLTGVAVAHRYRLAGDGETGRVRYLAIYELDGPDPAPTLAQLGERGSAWARAGRLFPGLLASRLETCIPVSRARP